jgi:hypothetical protein
MHEYNKSMSLMDKYDQCRDAIYARYERLFPTALDARLVQVLGGTTFTIGGIRRNGRPMTIVLSRGKMLRSRKFRKVVLDGMGCLANDVKWAIAIQGPEYERDVVTAYERDERLAAAGWRVAYIQVRDLWQSPERVRANLRPIFGA